jgi:hypothetical protein
MPQIGVTVSESEAVEIKAIAEREKRTISATASLLIAQALKERARLRQKSKKHGA